MLAVAPQSFEAAPSLAEEAADTDGAGTAPALDLRALLFLIRRNLLLIAAIIAGALGLGVAATMLSTPLYTASARIQIDQTTDRVLEDKASVQPEVSIQDAERFLQTQVDVLASRSMRLRVAKKLGLIGNAGFFTAMNAALPRGVQGAAPALVTEEATLALIERAVSFDLPRGSRVLMISVETPDAALSARLANAYSEEFIANNLERKFNSSSYARDFLADQLATAKQRLERAEDELNRYARASGLIRTGDLGADDAGRQRSGGSVTVDSLVQVNSATLTAQADRAAVEARWRAIVSQPALSTPEVLANSAVQRLLEERAKTQAELAQERSRHLDGHPSVQALLARDRQINGKLEELATQIRASLKSEYDAARLREDALDRQLRTFKTATEREQQASVRYNILSREADTSRTLYDELLQRFNQVSAAAGITTNNISLVDPATQPLRPSSPRLLINLALALVLGLVLAAVALLVREQLDDAIRVPEDIEGKLRLAVLGVIPAVEGDELPAMIADTKSSLNEAISSLRTSLLFSTTDGLPRTVAVTSSAASEGKSTTLFLLGLALARVGRRVVIIDADLRRPSLHQRVDRRNESGLINLLTSQDDPDRYIVKDAGETIDLLFAGPQPPNPTEMLSSGRLRELIEILEGRYDVVLIDGPPVLGLADAPLIAQVARGVIFVTESERGGGGSTKSALRRLREAGAPLLGAVLTKFDRQRAGSYYGYYDYDYYSYDAPTAGDRGTRPAAA